MIFRFTLVLLFFSLSLFAEWKIKPKIEVGFFSPSLDGSISNIEGSSDFSTDFLYDKASASYFAADVRIKYDYIPNLSISYFDLQENSDATLDKNVTVGEGVFGSKVTTLTDFSVLNTTFYQDFYTQGEVFSLFGKKFYTGDIEFDIGVNVKLLRWKFELRDQTDTSKASSWIDVHELVPLPYVGVNYYLYKLTLCAKASALSFVDAKAINYQASLSFRVINNLSLTAGYMYEEFKVVEDDDTIEFKASGYKVSFIYAF